jgi:threonine dehydratase
MITSEHIIRLTRESRSRISSHIIQTPLIWDAVSGLWLKCENLQQTGSFKFRGALSKLSTLIPGSTIVTASTGNHGLGVSTAAKLLGLNAIVFLPISASPQKLKKIKATGAKVEFVEGDSLAAELTGKAFAESNGLAWVSPYNDPEVIAGQGTIGMEICEVLTNPVQIYITVGGGGLVSGIATWMKSIYPAIEVIGCQPSHSREMFLSVQANKVVEDPDALPTLSDGSAGPLEEDSITFPLCQKLIDRFELVTEDEIRTAIRYAHTHQQMIIEGAAGAALAVALREQPLTQDKQRVVILCGGNIDPNVHSEICGYSL